MFFASASSLKGDGVRARPRPVGASGEVTTRAGTNPRSRSVASVSLATRGVPKYTKVRDVKRPSLGGVGCGGMFDLDEVLRVAGKEDGVQVVDLAFEYL